MFLQSLRGYSVTLMNSVLSIGIETKYRLFNALDSCSWFFYCCYWMFNALVLILLVGGIRWFDASSVSQLKFLALFFFLAFLLFLLLFLLNVERGSIFCNSSFSLCLLRCRVSEDKYVIDFPSCFPTSDGVYWEE